MSSSQHLSHHHFQNKEIDQIQQLLNNQQNSFHSRRYKNNEHWAHHIEDYENLDMGLQGQEEYEEIQHGNSQYFCEDSKKIGGQQQQLKPVHQHQDDQLANHKITKLPKNKKNKKITTLKQQNYLPSKNHYNQQWRTNSLKNISLSVLQQTSYTNLFNCFINTSTTTQSKNTKRRIYDIINVLTAVQIIKKHGQLLTKNSSTSSHHCHHKFKSQQPLNTLQLKKAITSNQQQIQKKISIIKQLQTKIKNLKKLYQRNSKQNISGNQSNIIYFPFICFLPDHHNKFYINQNFSQISVIIDNKQTMDILHEVDAIQYVNMKIRKKPTLKILDDTIPVSVKELFVRTLDKKNQSKL